MAGDTHAEVNFLRLLARCEAAKEESLTLDVKHYNKYLEALRGQVRSLTPRIKDETLISNYQQRVDFFASRLKPFLSAPSPPSSSLTSSSANSSSKSSSSSSPPTSPAVVQKPSLSVLRRRLLASEKGGKQGETTVQEKLKSHKEEQEQLTQDLVHLAGSLKENTKKQAKVLQEDDKVIDDLDTIVSNNVSDVRKENRRLQATLQNYNGMNISLCILMMFVAFAFIYIYVVLIKWFPKG